MFFIFLLFHAQGVRAEYEVFGSDTPYSEGNSPPFFIQTEPDQNGYTGDGSSVYDSFGEQNPGGFLFDEDFATKNFIESV